MRLDDAKACVRFIRSVARLTAQAAAQHVGQAPPAWKQMPRLALGVHDSGRNPGWAALVDGVFNQRRGRAGSAAGAGDGGRIGCGEVASRVGL